MKSIWEDTADGRDGIEGKTLSGNVKTDVLIIGGGMAGVLCAAKLREKGVSCVLAEAKRLGSGITKNTTAKITAQHGLIYADLIKKFGSEKALQYYTVNSAAVSEFRRLAETIPCDFEEKTAYVYSIDRRDKLEREAGAYQSLGIRHSFTESPPLPFETAGALGMECQAQFHPLKLLFGVSKGLDIYENCFISRIEDNKAYAGDGTITAGAIVLATHFPLVNIPGLYFLKMYQHRSYVIALQNGPDVNGMYVDEKQEGHSFRNYGDYLLIGGGDHKTGKKGGEYEELRKLAALAYPAAGERYAWATQDCMTLDAVPYIGVHRKSAPNLYVATGFNKWGITGSMVSAMVLSELITKGTSDYADLFSPQRSMLNGQLFLNTVSAVAGLLSFGKRCPHMGCALKWNDVEKTWDCPCHGSRFDRHGNLIDNPAKRGISVE